MKIPKPLFTCANGGECVIAVATGNNKMAAVHDVIHYAEWDEAQAEWRYHLKNSDQFAYESEIKSCSDTGDTVELKKKEEKTPVLTP